MTHTSTSQRYIIRMIIFSYLFHICTHELFIHFMYVNINFHTYHNIHFICVYMFTNILNIRLYQLQNFEILLNIMLWWLSQVFGLLLFNCKWQWTITSYGFTIIHLPFLVGPWFIWHLNSPVIENWFQSLRNLWYQF